MLLAVAGALLLVQGLGAVLVYRAQSARFEGAMVNAAAFKLAMVSRDSRTRGWHRGAPGPMTGHRGRGIPVLYTRESPVRAGEVRDAELEEDIAAILRDQGIVARDIVVTHRRVGDDAAALRHEQRRAERFETIPNPPPDRFGDHLLLVSIRTGEGAPWMTARVRTPRIEAELVVPLLLQTLTIYLVLMGAIALILRRITRPLATLTRRVETFAATQDLAGQVPPAGPDDMRRLIVAHNAMEARIVALLDEKDVMLGAIGHDLKTPLAALRVRIESVEDSHERERMARTIEDIVRTLDDILSLARVGRPSDPLERSELSAFVASIVEDYEDMGEPVELGEAERIVLELRPTWLRRALRNLIGNALRYGRTARVSLRREVGKAVIEVEDDGPGISEDRIEAMMEPFARGDPSRNTETGGAGLGLALARAIAEQHGGALTLANRIAADGGVAGLRARIELPLT
ncbi:two-component sensor histidine kinase [Novosphingobium sp. PC22D]|nr:two-component sensor histidine kinase [Novosphingobium sp. PC22D]